VIELERVLGAGFWSGLSTVEALSDKHGLPVAEIERRYAVAAAKVKAARETLGVQVEAAVAATHWIFKDESETAARYREEARKLFDAKDYDGAKAASKIATASHRLALEARRHLDDMTVRRPPTVAIHVAVMARPDFAAAFTIVAMILDGLWGPGAAARVERGLGAWEDMYAAGASEAQGREAVAAWIADEKAMVTAAGEVVEAEG
jgi:hypothetical protein